MIWRSSRKLLGASVPPLMVLEVSAASSRGVARRTRRVFLASSSWKALLTSGMMWISPRPRASSFDRRGIERSAADKGHLVACNGSDIHSAKKETAVIEDHAAKAIMRPGGKVDGVLGIVLRQFPAVSDQQQPAVVDPRRC